MRHRKHGVDRRPTFRSGRIKPSTGDHEVPIVAPSSFEQRPTFATVTPHDIRERNDKYISVTRADSREHRLQIVIRRRKSGRIHDIDEIPALAERVVIDRSVLGVASRIHL